MDVQKEGVALNHCIASYVDKILDNKTHIVFLRSNRHIDAPLVTVQVTEGDIKHMQGGKAISSEQQEFISKYKEYLSKL